MMSIGLLFLSTLTLTVVAGATATWMATSRTSAAKRAVVDRLAQIALLGAAAIFALLQSGAMESG